MSTILIMDEDQAVRMLYAEELSGEGCRLVPLNLTLKVIVANLRTENLFVKDLPAMASCS